MAANSNIYAWRIQWTEEPGGPQSIGSQRVRHDWSDLAQQHVAHTYINIYVYNISFLRFLWVVLCCMIWRTNSSIVENWFELKLELLYLPCNGLKFLNLESALEFFIFQFSITTILLNKTLILLFKLLMYLCYTRARAKLW